MAETISAVHHLTHIVKLKRDVVYPPSFYMIRFVQYWHRGNEIVESKSGFVTPSPRKERSEKISISIGRQRAFINKTSSLCQKFSILLEGTINFSSCFKKTFSLICFIICAFKSQQFVLLKANNINSQLNFLHSIDRSRAKCAKTSLISS